MSSPYWSSAHEYIENMNRISEKKVISILLVLNTLSHTFRFQCNKANEKNIFPKTQPNEVKTITKDIYLNLYYICEVKAYIRRAKV